MKTRKRKLINSSLQLRMTGVFLSVASLAALFQVLLLNSSVLELSRQLPEADEQIMRAFPGMLAKNILVTMVVLVPLMSAIGILVTHKIAGPAFRMEQYLRQVIAEGRIPDRPCKIRQGDEFVELCNLVNESLAVIAGTARRGAAPDVPVDEIPVEDVPGLVDHVRETDAETIDSEA